MMTKPSPTVQIFLSTVSAEFRSYRDALRHDLDRSNVTVKVQEDFIATGTETLDMLDGYIKHCDAVIHLVGDMTGALAQPPSVTTIRQRYPDFDRRLPVLSPFLQPGGQALPYTQWEAWLALYHAKPLIICVPEEGAPRDERYRVDPAQRDAQRDHLERLAAIERYPATPPFADEGRLAVIVLRSHLLDILASAEQTIRERAAAPVIDNLPQRNPQFTGRRAQLEKLRASFATARPNDVQTQAIFGHPGVGKTQVALEYAYRYLSEYNLAWWIPAETAAAIPAAFAQLATKVLPKAEHSSDQQAIVEAVLNELGRRTGWLLIFDNANDPDTLAPYLPARGDGHVLITSRNPNWSRWVASPLSIDLLPLEEAVQFLLRRTGRNDETSARALAEELGRLPLALEQAAAYMGHSKPLSDYLALFRRRRTELLALGKPLAHEGTVDTTIHLATDQLVGSPAALMLLTWCAFMAAENIPVYVLTEHKAVDRLPAEMRRMAGDEFYLDNVLEILYGSSLVTREDGTLRLHRLVQSVTRAHLSPADYQTWSELAIRLLLERFPSSIDDLACPKLWPRCEQLLPHIFAAAAYAEEAKVAGSMTAEMLMHLGSYLQHRGEYNEARNLFDRALTLAEAARGSDDLQVAHLLNAIGYLLRALGDPAEAQTKHERALSIIKAKLSDGDAEVGRTLNSLGRALYDQKNLTGALDNLRTALAITKIALGSDHPEVASILNNMGRVYYEQGELPSARDAHERALTIKERSPAFGPGHPSVAATLASLGRVLLAQRDVKGAREKLERAREIQETVLGEDHPDLGDTLRVLATVLEAEGDLAGAKTSRERAQSISDALLRPSRRRFRPQID